MNKFLITAGLVIPAAFIMSSCESCVRKTAKKATELTLSAVEGVSEALNEKGEETGRKAADALGQVAKGSLASIDELLDQHAADVAAAAGRTLVQSVEGLDKGVSDEFYTEMPYTADLPDGVALDYFGKIDSGAVTDAYFVITGEGIYNARFEYRDVSGKVLFENTASVTHSGNGESEYTVVSYALNPAELELFASTSVVAVKVTKEG